MQPQPALDRRQHRRRDAGVVVSYRAKHPAAIYDITHTRNISQGGMLLTTGRPVPAGDLLAIVARLPGQGSPSLVAGTAGAVESREIVPSLLYETRVRFLDLDRRSVHIMGEFCEGKVEQFAAAR